MQRISSFIRYIGRGGFAFLCLGVFSLAQAQPYEPVILYDMIGDTNDQYGGIVFEPLGDQDRDGYSDFLVNVGGRGGHLRIIYGASNPPFRLLDFAYLHSDSLENYIWGQRSSNPQEPLSADYNGDGIKDILVDLNNYLNYDSVYPTIFWGGGGPADFDTIWDWQSINFFGSRPLTGLGDFNADRDPDFTRSGNGSDRFLWYFDWSWPAPPTAPTWQVYRDAPTNNGNFESSNGVGDITGDGYPDFMHFLRYPNWSRHYEVWFGGPEADSIPDFQFIQDTMAVDIDYFGILGDVNGDGVDDMGGYVFDHFAPQRGPCIFYGGLPLNVTQPDIMLEHNSGEQISPLYFHNVGDINDDGYEDIGFKDTNRGSCYLFLGGNPMDSLWSFYLPAVDFDNFRTQLIRGIGDFNGDGVDDWAISSNEFRPGSVLPGRVTLFAGDRNWGVPVTNETPSIPNEFSLSVYPNPFNSTLSISLDVPLHQDVTLSLYDLLGREVDVVYRGRLLSSTISYVAPAELSSGVYFLRAAAGDVSVLRKVVLLK